MLYLVGALIMNNNDTIDSVDSSGEDQDSERSFTSVVGGKIGYVSTATKFCTKITRSLLARKHIRKIHKLHIQCNSSLVVDDSSQNPMESIKFSVWREPQSQTTPADPSELDNLLYPSCRYAVVSRHYYPFVRRLFTVLQEKGYLDKVRGSDRWSEVMQPKKDLLVMPEKVGDAFFGPRSFSSVSLLCWYVDIEKMGDTETLVDYIVRSADVPQKRYKLLWEYFQRLPSVLVIDNVSLPDGRLRMIEKSLLPSCCVFLFTENHFLGELDPSYSHYEPVCDVSQSLRKSRKTISDTITNKMDNVADKYGIEKDVLYNMT